MLPWLSFGAEANPFQRWNPFRPLAHWYFNRRVDKYISRGLQNRFAYHQELDETGIEASQVEDDNRPRLGQVLVGTSRP